MTSNEFLLESMVRFGDCFVFSNQNVIRSLQEKTIFCNTLLDIVNQALFKETNDEIESVPMIEVTTTMTTKIPGRPITKTKTTVKQQLGITDTIFWLNTLCNDEHIVYLQIKYEKWMRSLKFKLNSGFFFENDDIKGSFEPNLPSVEALAYIILKSEKILIKLDLNIYNTLV